MIYTITLNPTIDYIVTVPQLTLGHSHHMQNELITPGGKGIMVSRVLKALGIPSIALGFRGGFTGDFVRDYMEELNILNQFTERLRNDVVLRIATLEGIQPAALKELDKIEMVRLTDNRYRLDHAVTAAQKTILKAFGMDANVIRHYAAEISGMLKEAK